MGTEYIAVGFTILFTIATSALLGGYMYRVFTGERTLLDPIFVPIERLVLLPRGLTHASSRTGNSTRSLC
jgi:K+-transporting ATPase ATPase A chain